MQATGTTCSNCGGDDVRRAEVRSAFWHEDRLVVVQDIPALLCAGCGEQFYDDTEREIIRAVGYAAWPYEPGRVALVNFAPSTIDPSDPLTMNAGNPVRAVIDMCTKPNDLPEWWRFDLPAGLPRLTVDEPWARGAGAVSLSGTHAAWRIAQMVGQLAAQGALDQRRQQLAGREDLARIDGGLVRQAIGADPCRHHDLFERRVAGTFADAVHRAFDLARAGANGCQRVGHRQAEVGIMDARARPGLG